MPLLSHFTAFFPSPPAGRLLLAVSGGVDSVVLCELAFRSGLPFVIAHCHFGLRGAESDRDAAFVQALAAKYGVEYFEKKFDTTAYAAARQCSVQVAAREMRYDWFDALLATRELSLTCLLTAHHADDNIETVLMHFFRGTGIAGMRGMLPVQGKLLRPLLALRKADLLAFATAEGLSFVEDSSNASEKYTRNYFRHTLIPGVQAIFPQAEENILQNIARFRDVEIIYRQHILQLQKKLLQAKGSEWQLPVLLLQKTPALNAVLYEIMKPFGFQASQLPDLLHLLEAESGKYVASATHRVLKNRNWLIVSPVTVTDNRHFLLEAGDTELVIPEGKLVVQKIFVAPGKTFRDYVSDDPHVLMMDARFLQFPLLLRRWKTGDYFYPLGMNKKKKLSRFFIDQKLAVSEKEKIWVLEMHRKIVWIVGHRMDDRFKLTAATREIFCLRLVI
jgi:tRNA(Ile)-lysidine synthase